MSVESFKASLVIRNKMVSTEFAHVHEMKKGGQFSCIGCFTALLPCRTNVVVTQEEAVGTTLLGNRSSRAKEKATLSLTPVVKHRHLIVGRGITPQILIMRYVYVHNVTLLVHCFRSP